MTTLIFRDVSHYQGAYKPTGPTIAKATEGTSFVDPAFAGDRTRAAAAADLFLPYHFLAHGNIAAQVAHVIATIGHREDVMLDVEYEAGKPDPTLDDVYGFADAFREASGGGKVSLGYIPEWFWAGHWHSPSLGGLTARRIGLVSSHYSAYSDTGPGWSPYGGVTPVIWQYADKPYDTNAFKGTPDQLHALWHPRYQIGSTFIHPAGSRTLTLQTPLLVGHDVVVCQDKVGAHPDGTYGPGTVTAVKTWQRNHKLVADGEVGPKTWTSMGVTRTP